MGFIFLLDAFKHRVDHLFLVTGEFLALQECLRHLGSAAQGNVEGLGKLPVLNMRMVAVEKRLGDGRYVTLWRVRSVN